MKQACPPAELCKNCPMQYRKYFEYCEQLEFDEEPDYAMLKKLISDAAYQHGYDLNDKTFDWCIKLQMVPGFSSGTSPNRSREHQAMEADQSKVMAAQRISSNINNAAAGGLHQNSNSSSVAGKPITCSDFQFKSYVAVRTIIYQAHAIRNQFII